MLNGVHESGPEVGVWLAMKAKVREKVTWDGCTKIGLNGDSIGAPFQKSPKMLETWAYSHDKELIAVKALGQTITHILEGRETALILNGSRIGSIG
jgi:hypothetical protein